MPSLRTRVGAEHGLEGGVTLDLVRARRGGAGELGDDRFIFEGHDAGIAEDPPGGRDDVDPLAGAGLDGLDQGIEGAVARVDIEEFVGIGHQDPVGGLDRLVGPEPVIGAVLGVGMFAVALAAVLEVGDFAHGVEVVEHLAGAVLAIVGGDDDAVEADQLVVTDPFQQVGAFVLDRSEQGFSAGDLSCGGSLLGGAVAHDL